MKLFKDETKTIKKTYTSNRGKDENRNGHHNMELRT
jgi:hypothetical protein